MQTCFQGVGTRRVVSTLRRALLVGALLLAPAAWASVQHCSTPSHILLANTLCYWSLRGMITKVEVYNLSGSSETVDVEFGNSLGARKYVAVGTVAGHSNKPIDPPAGVWEGIDIDITSKFGTDHFLCPIPQACAQ